MTFPNLSDPVIQYYFEEKCKQIHNEWTTGDYDFNIKFCECLNNTTIDKIQYSKFYMKSPGFILNPITGYHIEINNETTTKIELIHYGYPGTYRGNCYTQPQLLRYFSRPLLDTSVNLFISKVEDYTNMSIEELTDGHMTYVHL